MKQDKAHLVVPTEVRDQLKAIAALKGKSLQEFHLQILEKTLEKEGIAA